MWVPAWNPWLGRWLSEKRTCSVSLRTRVQISSTHIKRQACLPVPVILAVGRGNRQLPRAHWLGRLTRTMSFRVRWETMSQGNKAKSNRDTQCLALAFCMRAWMWRPIYTKLGTTKTKNPRKSRLGVPWSWLASMNQQFNRRVLWSLRRNVKALLSKFA